MILKIPELSNLKILEVSLTASQTGSCSSD